ncbi:MAG: hypothetical protein E7Z64_04860 [Thermoplasmata archaeon]|nr:hypothetical protein [Thermoplasmata archaeon]
MNTKVIIAIAFVGVLIAGGYAVILLMNDDDDSKKDVGGYGLEIFGNIDGDNDVDSKDADLLNDYINAKNQGDDLPEITEYFADVNGDGRIDSKDVDAIRTIASGKAKEIRFLDGNNNEMTVSTDIQRIGAEYFCNTELCMILGIMDRVVAVDFAPYQMKEFYFQDEKARASVKNMAAMNNPDYDMINGLELDVLLSFSYDEDLIATKQAKLVDCDVIYLGLYAPDLIKAENSAYVHGILKAGYIFGKVDRAEAYVDWILDKLNYLMDKTKDIEEKDKPHVLMTNYQNSYLADDTRTNMSVYNYNDPQGQAVIVAGGHNVLQDISEDAYKKGYSASLQYDAIFNDDPKVYVDYIFCHSVQYTYAGTEIKGVSHGYTTNDYSDFEKAWKHATGKELVKDELDSPDNLHIDSGDLRNGCSGGVLLAYYVAKVINPEIFSDIDPVKMHNDYVKDWLGVSGYDVSEDAVVIYKQM